MHRYFWLHLSSVLGFPIPREGSTSRNWDEIMVVGLFLHSSSDLTTATGCCRHTRQCVTVITGSCDLLSFELLRIFAIWWASLLKCNLYSMVVVLTHTLTPPVERWCLRQRWKRCHNEKENWRIVPAIRYIDTPANTQFNYIIFGYRASFQLTLKYLRNPVSEGTKDVSTLEMCSLIVLSFYSEISMERAGRRSTQMAQCR